MGGNLKTSTLARPDAYSVSLSGPLTASSVLTNDFGLPTKTVLSFGPSASPASVVANGSNSSPSDQGGTVVMNTNGTFSYTPTGSFVGYDKFGYTATTTTPPTDAATVTIGVGTPVTALPNAYSITGNVTNTQAAPGLLGNDVGDLRVVSAVNGLTANVGIGVTTAQSGTVTVVANGGFVYEPPAGYNGPDSFTYSANNGYNAPSTAVVSLSIVDMIWFVNAGAGSNGTGTLARPFNNLASFAALNNGSGNNPAAGDNIFLYSGTYTGGLTLLATQKLIGVGATATLASIAGITPAAGSAALPATGGADPIITNGSGNGVSLSTGNLLRGLTLGNSSANALAGSGFGTVSVADLTINTTGQALALTAGAVAGSFDSVSSTAGVSNVALTSVTSSFNINGGNLTGASGSSFSVSGGSVSVTYSGSMAQSNNAALVSISAHATGTLTFQTGTLNATNGTGLQFSNADGTYNFNGTTTLNGGDAGIDITTGSGGTFTFGSNTSITNPSGIAYREDTSTPTVTYNGSITKTNNANIAVDINAKTGGTTAFGGAITASTTTANAIDLTNTGGTVNLGGNNLAITTTSGIGFNATGSGTTVNVTGTGNTITSGTGTALNVANTTIGANGLTFQSISANGGANGIVLNTTGSSGGLTVTGDGTNTTKGGNASGGTIQNMNGSDATTAGIGIYLNNTANVVLRRMTINGTIQNMGLYALSVTGFTMQYCTIGGTIGTTSGSNDLTLECPISFGKSVPSGLNGFGNGSVATLDNCLISGGIQHNVQVYQQANSFSLTISNSNITNNGTALGSDGIQIETHTDGNAGTPRASATISVQNCNLSNNKSQALQASALGDSFIDITANGNTIQKTTQGNEGIILQNATDGDLSAHVTNNTFSGILGTNILVGQVANNATANSSLTAVVSSNTMTVGAVGGPYPANRTLIAFLSSTVGQVSNANILISGNLINTQSHPTDGIAEPLFVSTPDANTDPAFTATVLNNVVNINDPGGTSLRGIAVQSTQDVSAGCIDVRGNDVNYTPSAPSGINGIRVRQVSPGTLNLIKQGSSAGAATTVLAANNPLSTTEVSGTVTVVANSSCLTPPN